jgi:hypothetical protein
MSCAAERSWLPAPSVIEHLVAAAMMLAERHVAHQLTRDLSAAQAEALDALLTTREGTSISVLAWARQPPGAPTHRALARLLEQRAVLSAIALDPVSAEGVHPERLRRLAREGARFTAQHLRVLSSSRRRSTLVATVLDTITCLTDDSGADWQEAVAAAIRWDKLARSVAEANRLARPDKTDLTALAGRAWPVLHRLGPLFLGPVHFRAMPAAIATLRAVELLHAIYESGGQKWPPSLPTSFLRPAWREAVLGVEPVNRRRRIWEAATLLALRDRLGAGDIWVEGAISGAPSRIS